MQESGPKAWEDPLSQIRCHTLSVSINHLLKALKDTFFLFGPFRDPFDAPSGGEGVFTHKHLLIQIQKYTNLPRQPRQAAHSTYVH